MGHRQKTGRFTAENRGFTLLELLVVLLILGITGSVAALAIDSGADERALSRYSRNLQTALTHLKQKAILGAQTFTLIEEFAGIRLYRLKQGRWERDESFNSLLPNGRKMEIAIEGRSLFLDSLERERNGFLIYPGGEFSPATLTLKVAQGVEEQWQLEANGLMSRVERVQ